MLLEGKTMQLQIVRDNIEAFLCCLGIGTLYAIRAETLPAEAGIWSLGVPRMWEPLANKSLISEGIIDVFQRCDELSAIQELLPDEFEATVTELIERLQAELGKKQDPVWQMEWLFDSEDNL